MSSSIYRKIDWSMIFCYLFLVLFGWLNIYSAVGGKGAPILDFSTQYGMHLVWIVSAILIAAFILFVLSPKIYLPFAWWLYAFVLILLFAVIFVGVEINGSKSWFAIGPFRLQPAEFSKISTSLAIAALMGKYGFSFHYFRDKVKAFATIGVPILLIIMEKETGSALVYLGFLFAFYREGMSGWVILCGAIAVILFILTLIFSPFISLLILLGIIAIFYAVYSGKFWKNILLWSLIIVALSFIPALLKIKPVAKINHFDAEIWLVILTLPVALFFMIKALFRRMKLLRNAMLGYICGVCMIFSVDFAFNHILQDHQRARIEILLGIREDPMGVGYNVHQSMIAIGSGGFLGKGFLNGTQTRFDFVPEQSTDFIFCTIGEEWGFAGALVVLGVYLFLILRICRSAEKQKDAFVRIYGYCVACCLIMHVLINISMTVGLMPVIGIPLPFISYGGSSLWAFTILLFIYIRLDLERWR